MHCTGNPSRTLTRLLLLGFVVLLGCGLSQMPPLSAAAEAAGANVLFILDGSGSMWEKLGKNTKMTIAKEKMTELIKALPENIRMGLEVYGHREKGSCEDIEMLVPLGQGDKATLIRQLHAITPKGKTPITGALQRAGAALATAEEDTTIVLISDGKETCGGDPCTLVRDLRAKGFKVTVHVVGFDVPTDERTQLQCIADAGGGQYFAAQNALQLKEALKKIRDTVVRVPPPPPVPKPQQEEEIVRVRTGIKDLGTLRLLAPDYAYASATV